MSDLLLFIGAGLAMVGATAYILYLFWKAGWLNVRWPWKR